MYGGSIAGARTLNARAPECREHNANGFYNIVSHNLIVIKMF